MQQLINKTLLSWTVPAASIDLWRTEARQALDKTLRLALLRSFPLCLVLVVAFIWGGRYLGFDLDVLKILFATGGLFGLLILAWLGLRFLPAPTDTIYSVQLHKTGLRFVSSKGAKVLQLFWRHCRGRAMTKEMLVIFPNKGKALRVPCGDVPKYQIDAILNDVAQLPNLPESAEE